MAPVPTFSISSATSWICRRSSPGTVTVDAEEIFFSNLVDMVARPFRHEAETRQLSFDVHVDPNLGRSITTDSKRLQQVLKNLLSNAFKFTGSGRRAA